MSPVEEREKSRGGSSSTLTSTPTTSSPHTHTPSQHVHTTSPLAQATSNDPSKCLLRDDLKRDREEHIKRNRRSTGRLTHHNHGYELPKSSHHVYDSPSHRLHHRLGVPSSSVVLAKPVHKSASASSLTLLIPAHGSSGE